MAAPYTRSQIRLHWIIFVLIAFQFLANEPIGNAWRQFTREGSAAFAPMVAAHVIVGVLILALVGLRIVLRLRYGAPALPEEESAAMQMVARLTHLGLYGLMLLVPVSGMAAWFGGVKPAADTHEVLTTLLLLLVGLHVLGALYQQFVLKTNLMARMTRPG